MVTADDQGVFADDLTGLEPHVSVRGGADEAEIDRMIDAMHATVDTWRV